MLLKIREGSERARTKPGEGPRSRSRSVPAPDGDVTAGGNKGRGTGRAAPALSPPPRRRHRVCRPPGAPAPAETKRLPPRYVRAERERFGPPSAGAAAAGRRRPQGRCGPAPGERPPTPASPGGAPLPPPPLPDMAAAAPDPAQPRLRSWLCPTGTRGAARCHPRWGTWGSSPSSRGERGPPSASSRSGGGSAPSASPPQRAARSRPAGEAHASPGPKRLSSSSNSPAASRSAPLRSRPDPRAGGAAGRASHPPWGSGLRWVRPPRGCPARFCFPVTSSLRTGLCRTGRPGSSSHPSLPAGPGQRPRGLAGLRAPRPRRGDSPARPRRDEAGQDGLGDPAACWAPPAPKWWEPLRSAPERGVCLCSGHGGASGRSGPAGRDGTGLQRGPPAHPTPAGGVCASPRDLLKGFPAGGSQAGKGVPCAGRWGHGQRRDRTVSPSVEQNQQQALGSWVSKGFLCDKQTL